MNNQPPGMPPGWPGPHQPPPQPVDPQTLLWHILQQQQQQQQQHQQDMRTLLQAMTIQRQPIQEEEAREAQRRRTQPQPPPQLKAIPVTKLSSPEHLTVAQFRAWRTRWEDHASSQQLHLQSLVTQQAVLRSALDDEWILLWSSDRFLIDHNTTTENIVAQFENYIRRRRNPLLDRMEFLRRDQQEGESVDRYYAALRLLDDACAHELDIRCSNCSRVCTSTCTNTDCEIMEAPLFPMLQETRIRDRLICGLRNKETRRKILAKQYDNSTLTIENVLSICAAEEQSESATNALDVAGSSGSAINAVKSQYKRQQSASRPNSPLPTSTSRTNEKYSTTAATGSRNAQLEERCGHCGYIYPADTTHDCPAKGHRCTKCKRKNHWEKVCRSRPWPPRGRSPTPNREATPHDASSTVAGPSLRTHSVSISHMSQQAQQTLLPINVRVNEFEVSIPFLCDTGADADIFGIPEFMIVDQNTIICDIFSFDVPKAQAANATELRLMGKIPATMTLNGYTYKTEVYISRDVDSPILSKRGCECLGLIPANWPHSQLVSHGEQTKIATQAISTAKKTIAIHPSLPSTSSSAIRDQLIQEFSEIFNDEILKPMKGPPMKIELIDGAVPSRRYKAYTVPIHWKKPVKEQLDSMERKGVIEKVPVGESYEWCHPMVVVPKKGSNEPRITVDLTGLNKYVRRPAYPTRAPREVVASIAPGQNFFTTLDARHGYWQIPLDNDSKKLTTFITPWGSYRFCRNVMGLISAGDEHNRRGDEAIQGISNTAKIVEDIVLYDTDIATHTQRVREILLRCQEHGITLNAKKFAFAQPQAEWCGYLLTNQGYTLAPHLVSAIRNFPVPKSRTDVRSFLGLVQQFETFSSRIAELSDTLRALLPKNTAFVWEAPHQKAFEDTIAELSSSRVLAHFTPGKPLRLETDAAQTKGLGFALWQLQDNNEWRLLRAGSRYVTPTEANYSPTEVELLGVVWATRKCRLFLLGQPFELIVDHSPLTRIIDAKTLDQIENPRLQRLKEKLALFQIHTTWRKGTQHTVVDVLSRYPVSHPEQEDICDFDDPAHILRVSVTDPEDESNIIPDQTLEDLKMASQRSIPYQKLKRAILTGIQGNDWNDSDLLPFKRYRDDLSVVDDLILLGTRLIIPHELRRTVLKALHASHQGQERTLRRARQAVFWPGITNDVKTTVQACQPCQMYLPSQCREPICSSFKAEFPFQIVATDLFSYSGNEYIVVVDKYSGWPSVAKLGTSATTHSVTGYLIQLFTDTGIPELIISDNGPQFSSLEFRQWCAKWSIRHHTSSPHYPQSNGLAESAVKAIKHLLAKTSPRGDCYSEEFCIGLLELRNSPRADGYSPAEIVLGAPTRSLLPLHHSKYARKWRDQLKIRDDRASSLEQKADQRYNASSHKLKDFTAGDIVLLQNPNTRRWDTLAEIVDTTEPRSYQLRTDAGRLLRRNRRFVRPYIASTPSPGPELSNEPPDLRRSSRLRSPPKRFAEEYSCDRRSRFEGGDIGKPCRRIPQLAGQENEIRSILKQIPSGLVSCDKSFADAVKGQKKKVDFVLEE